MKMQYSKSKTKGKTHSQSGCKGGQMKDTGNFQKGGKKMPSHSTHGKMSKKHG